MNISKKDFISNMIFGIFFAVFGLAMICSIIPNEIDLSLSGTANIGVTSQTFPFFASTVVTIASFGLIIYSCVRLIRTKHRLKLAAQNGEATDTNNKQKVNWKNEGKALAIFGLCVLYAIIYINVGFLIASILILPATLFMLGSRNLNHYTAVYMIAIAMYLVFRFALNVLIP